MSNFMQALKSEKEYESDEIVIKNISILIVRPF
jgi:hypothetical protein